MTTRIWNHHNHQTNRHHQHKITIGGNNGLNHRFTVNPELMDLTATFLLISASPPTKKHGILVNSDDFANRHTRISEFHDLRHRYCSLSSHHRSVPMKILDNFVLRTTKNSVFVAANIASIFGYLESPSLKEKTPVTEAKFALNSARAHCLRHDLQVC
ncbi:hypothetical protein L484_004149 [Morus notabilis]|uniref:Uncharacterized protein n=1 Tax=Morus notabilis TaxID=981085 RepID=W9QMA5_9ROSA|nr:hypothetical protein L484_004149 [Morus notabilis]